MTEEQILKDLEQAIVNYDVEGARKAAKRALEKGVDPIVAIERGVAKGGRIAGEKFHRLEIFLPHLMMAGEAMTEAIKVLETAISKEKKKSVKRGIIVIGTVEGDLHDIGKNIVGSLLKAAGFEVHDIGKDVPAERFIEKAQEVGADIIATSALMSITVDAQRELIEELKRLGLRDKFKVVIGGGITSQEWAEEIGADGYGKDGPEAVEVVEKLLGDRGTGKELYD